jgi:2-polyprenyl-3-methyl-5-hydroxy-6-metoxy-1,4-benzoquinol methylase
LDVGCGEGADAIWLAQQGWRATGVDLSALALQRAAAHARQVSMEVAEKIEWVHADVTTWDSGSTRYALVSAQYMHLASAARLNLFAHLAAVVAVDGTLPICRASPLRPRDQYASAKPY